MPLILKSADEIELDSISRHPIVVLRGQDLSQEQLTALARRIGRIDTRVSRTEVTSIGAGEAEMDAHVELPWHQDLSFMNPPPRWVILYAHQIEGESVTEWCDHVSATAALAPEILARHRGSEFEHAAANISRVDQFPYRVEDEARRRWLRRAKARHPAVARDEAGRDYLFFNPGYVSLPADDVRVLCSHFYQSPYIYSHRWQAGDLVITNNLTTSHRRQPHPATLTRRLSRIHIL